MIKNKISKKIVASLALALAFTMTGLVSISEKANAHGYVNKGRAALGKEGINVNVGGAQYEPQSIESVGNFPESGPADGQIASAGHFPELDEQSADRWVKVPMKGGKNTFTWTLTAPHRTSEWKYYITKKGWDVNDKLERSDFEQIERLDGNNEIPLKTVTHTINVPTDREGYYVILGVWEIADTGNAFYQVMDVDLSNDGQGGSEDNIAPTAPTSLDSANQTTNSIDLTWNKSSDNVAVSHYNVYRDNKKVQTALGTSVTDINLSANTTYTYTVKAVDNSGNESLASNEIKVKTKDIPQIDNEAPTAPTSVHSMGETTSTIDLHWATSTDNVGVSHYDVYRNGVKIKTLKENRFMDFGLNSNTEYTYTVKAIDFAGNVSEESKSFKVKTKEIIAGDLTAWDKNKVYLAGDKVTYNGIEYTAKWWTSGDMPGQSDVWESSSKETNEWTSSKAYNGGDRVTYNGVTYEAKWWTKGDKPDSSDVWKRV
ncbi:MAG: lytic polysaccharide monooxygenase [Clostridium sp.]